MPTRRELNQRWICSSYYSVSVTFAALINMTAAFAIPLEPQLDNVLLL